MLMQDIGSNRIDGDGPAQGLWGFLISYHDEDVVGRYEGQGTLTVAIGPYGVVNLSGMSFADVVISRLNH